MKDNFISDPLFPECPIRNVLARVCSKWSLVVLYTLDKAGVPIRYKDIEKQNPDITQKMLVQTLRALETDGLILRQAYAETPPRVEYSLTERGKSLMPILHQLFGWAYSHLHDITAAREQRHMA
ncbi:MAG: putative HTH-type transcriptional activator HxlR [bacterium P3]|nr:MAG: putative HTH-type transcriptional activator HxlR [bacterium P3]KWW39013.1 MAG: putative HTH-type transcriptional activator HxlR [bacterium F083]